MVSYNVLSCWAQLVSVFVVVVVVFCFFWRDVKFSLIVIYIYKFGRMDCTLN